ncbi:MAG: NAD-dependent epimerase/dehydratase family protein [Spirochaetaceae bacterium]|nr:MAG: NAD-dependent epimerase/dehydratase family protein [Spirochaetaceae bacterium]
MRILVIGGSGFLSGTITRRAVAAGHDVWTVTRGKRPVPAGAHSIVVDRHDSAAFLESIRAGGSEFDIVIDCICFTPDDAAQDIEAFRGIAGRIVFISTDFVYAPDGRRFPQPEYPAVFLTEGYGGKKRAAELVFESLASDDTPWTILRPGHIYGPGSLLGCLPMHSRDQTLLDTIRAGRPLSLVGRGVFLQQPVFVDDLADLAMGLGTDPAAKNTVFNAAGPDILESRRYYEIIGDVLERRVTVEELSISSFLEENPDKATFICHRVYTRDRIAATLTPAPATSIETGLAEHVRSILASREK